MKGLLVDQSSGLIDNKKPPSGFKYTKKSNWEEYILWAIWSLRVKPKRQEP